MSEPEQYRKTRQMVGFFDKELEEARKKRGKSEVLLMISRGSGGRDARFALQKPRKDAAAEMGIDASEADGTFLRAVRAGLIAADFGREGPNVSTAVASVTHITPEGLAMLGEWKAERDIPAQSFVFNAPAYGVFGSQQDFSFEQVVGDLDRLVEERGGNDADELREMVGEVRATLENQDSITRSKFERWSELANKHAPWLLGPLGSLLVNYAFGAAGPS